MNRLSTSPAYPTTFALSAAARPLGAARLARWSRRSPRASSCLRRSGDGLFHSSWPAGTAPDLRSQRGERGPPCVAGSRQVLPGLLLFRGRPGSPQPRRSLAWRATPSCCRRPDQEAADRGSGKREAGIALQRRRCLPYARRARRILQTHDRRPRHDPGFSRRLARVVEALRARRRSLEEPAPLGVAGGTEGGAASICCRSWSGCSRHRRHLASSAFTRRTSEVDAPSRRRWSPPGPRPPGRSLSAGPSHRLWAAWPSVAGRPGRRCVRAAGRDQAAVPPRVERRGRRFAQRFARERDILASLRHPHIAGLHDAGVTPDGQPWLALSYVEGQPITTCVRCRGVMPIPDPASRSSARR